MEQQVVDYNTWLHDIEKATLDFDCGIDEINDYLKSEVNKPQNDSERRLLLYVSDDKILGFVSFSLVQFNVSIQNKKSQLTDPVLYINGLGVDKEFQKRKIGSLLLSIVLRTASTINVLAPIKGVRLTAYRDSTDFYDAFEFSYLRQSPDRDFNSKEFPMFMDIDFINTSGFDPYYNIFDLSKDE